MVDGKMHEHSVLDDIETIRRIDRNRMLEHCAKTSRYGEVAMQRAERVEIPNEVRISEKRRIKYGKPRHVIVAGMGGSAIGGDLLRGWLIDDLPLPIEVCRDYYLPAYADEGTLVFAISYSGNTEETLSAFVDALRRGCMVIAITSGGHLLSFSERLQIPCMTIPDTFPPRVAIPYLFFPLHVFMERLDILLKVEDDLAETLRVLEEVAKENAPENPTEKNLSKRLALELVGTVPVVYGFRQYGAIAHRLKTQFNENSKVPCRYDVFPELNHNEAVGWEAPESITKRFSVILIRDPDEPPEIKHRIEATRLLALHKARKVLEIHTTGEGRLAKMFSAMHVGDFTSIYLAILQGLDPTPVDIIDKIKVEMDRRFRMVDSLKVEIQKITEEKL